MEIETNPIWRKEYFEQFEDYRTCIYDILRASEQIARKHRRDFYDCQFDIDVGRLLLDNIRSSIDTFNVFQDRHLKDMESLELLKTGS